MAGVQEKTVQWRPGDTHPQLWEAPDPAALCRGTVSLPTPACSPGCWDSPGSGRSCSELKPPGRWFRLPRPQGHVCMWGGALRGSESRGRSQTRPGVQRALVWARGSCWLGARCVLYRERGHRLSHGSEVSPLVSAWARDAVRPSPLGPASRATILF